MCFSFNILHGFHVFLTSFEDHSRVFLDKFSLKSLVIKRTLLATGLSMAGILLQQSLIVLTWRNVISSKSRCAIYLTCAVLSVTQRESHLHVGRKVSYLWLPQLIHWAVDENLDRFWSTEDKLIHKGLRRICRYRQKVFSRRGLARLLYYPCFLKNFC